jgi:hypothetical protein
MPRAANPFSFDAIADVLISMDYTALSGKLGQGVRLFGV